MESQKSKPTKYSVFTQKPLIVYNYSPSCFVPFGPKVKTLPVVHREVYEEFILHTKLKHLGTYTVNVSVKCKNGP